jgi:hypothetical protein
MAPVIDNDVDALVSPKALGFERRHASARSYHPVPLTSPIENRNPAEDMFQIRIGPPEADKEDR